MEDSILPLISTEALVMKVQQVDGHHKKEYFLL